MIMATLQEKRTLEERVKALEDWGNNMAMIGNYNASRIHTLEGEVNKLERELEDLKKRFEGSR